MPVWGTAGTSSPGRLPAAPLPAKLSLSVASGVEMERARFWDVTRATLVPELVARLGVMLMAEERKPRPGDLVFANALDFLNMGLRILFADEAIPREAKVGVVSIQTAIELLLKYRLIKDGGFSSIVNGSIPEGDLVAAASSGRLRTIGYGQSLKIIGQHEGFSETERELFRRVQNLRNALVHFTAEVDVNEVRMELAWVLVGALGIFAAGEEREQGEFQTHARFLDPDVFERLTNFGPYQAQSVDSAIESLDGENVYRCWECGVDALSARLSENYFCHCCGLTVIIDAAAFVSCALCGEADGVCFDPLNETRGVYRGKCLHCETFVGVVVCEVCGVARSQAEGLPALECPVCVDLGI